VAKRKKKSASSKKPAKKPAKKGTVAEKHSNKGNGGAKSGGTAAPDKAASRAGSATLLPPSRPRTTAQSQEMRDTAGEAAPTSDRGIAAIDEVRTINHVDQAAGGLCPTQTGEHAAPTHAARIAEGAAEKEDRLEEITDDLANADKVKVDRHALWWTGTARLPRAAIVGRALHDLESFNEELASQRGNAAGICLKIKDKNPEHLREPIKRAMLSGKDSDVIDAALIGHLNKALAVLEKLDYLRAAPRAGVYLIGEGQKVFNGFPDWKSVDEPWPEAPTRPPRRPRS
jgi:hypothetical protein